MLDQKDFLEAFDPAQSARQVAERSGLTPARALEKAGRDEPFGQKYTLVDLDNTPGRHPALPSSPTLTLYGHDNKLASMRYGNQMIYVDFTAGNNGGIVVTHINFLRDAILHLEIHFLYNPSGQAESISGHTYNAVSGENAKGEARIWTYSDGTFPNQILIPLIEEVKNGDGSLIGVGAVDVRIRGTHTAGKEDAKDQKSKIGLAFVEKEATTPYIEEVPAKIHGPEDLYALLARGFQREIVNATRNYTEGR